MNRMPLIPAYLIQIFFFSVYCARIRKINAFPCLFHRRIQRFILVIVGGILLLRIFQKQFNTLQMLIVCYTGLALLIVTLHHSISNGRNMFPHNGYKMG